MNFVNGFDSWHETHFEIVSVIKFNEDIVGTKVNEIAATEGSGGLYELAKKLTSEFEELYKGVNWEGDFFDELDEFLTERL